MRQRQAVLFDLDGTLLDTAPDLVAALNLVLREQGQAEAALADYRPYVGRGAGGLIKEAFGLDIDDPKALPLQQRLVQHYRQSIDQHTRFFDGIEQLLAALDSQQIPWGVVTNKMAALTEPLLQKMGLLARAKCVVSGDTTAERKPSPMPLLYACELAGFEPESTVYLGDDIRDVQAANRAGMVSLAASYGYLQAHDSAETWGADGIVGHPDQILAWLEA